MIGEAVSEVAGAAVFAANFFRFKRRCRRRSISRTRSIFLCLAKTTPPFFAWFYFLMGLINGKFLL